MTKKNHVNNTDRARAEPIRYCKFFITLRSGAIAIVQCALRPVRAMTRPMHQDAAATAVLRRTMVLLLLLLIFSFSTFPSVTAECPDKCTCHEESVYCSNQKLDRIPDRIPPATTFLGLDDNHISEVKNGSFSNLSNLQTLYLYNNKIENIETGVFNNLTSLEVLHLHANKIHKLDLDMFKGLTKLNELALDDNDISELKNGAFSDLSKLRRLFLSSNRIENIETGVFNNLMSLEVLNLQANKIHKLDLEIFKRLTKLTELYRADWEEIKAQENTKVYRPT